MRTAIICFLVFVMMSSIVNGQPKALKPPCEFILLIDGSKSVNREYPGNFQKMVNLVNKWPDHFLISEQASRVAVVQFGGNASLELQLTGNESSIRGLTFKHQAQTTNTHLGLEMVKNQVFNLAREDALKIVIIITDGASTEKELANKAAEDLRDAKAITYALYIGDEYNTVQDTKNHVDNDLAGDKERVFNINDFGKFIQDILNRHGQSNHPWPAFVVGGAILCVIVGVICISSGLCGTGKPTGIQGDQQQGDQQQGVQPKKKGKGHIKIAKEEDDFGSASVKTLNNFPIGQ